MQEEKQERDSSGRKDKDNIQIQNNNKRERGKEEKDRMINVAVAGVRGYTGAELIKILINHPKIRKIKAFSTEEGKISDFIPSLRKFADIESEKFSEEKLNDSDFLFLCLESNQAHKIVSSLIEKGIKTNVIDLSPDFRFNDISKYRELYGFDHSIPGIFSKVAYGLTELYREEIEGAHIIANPGCYPTAFLIAVAPLLDGYEKEKIDFFVIDAKSGVTGAGRKSLPHLTFGYMSENIKVYAWTEHRHVPEIKEKLKEKFSVEKDVFFTAQLIPAKRGIMETIWVKLKEEIEFDKVVERYEKFASTNKFFDFTGEDFPDIYSVIGTNMLRVGMRYDRRAKMLMLVSVIDNLVKGAAGQAVQNMNIKAKLPEEIGLDKLPPSFS